MTIIMKKKILTFLGITVISVILLLCECWFNTYPSYVSEWIQSISYFALTWICAYKLKQTGISLYAIVTAVILGRILLEIPIRITDFHNSLGSFMNIITSIIGIILGAICYYEKRILPISCLLLY